MAGRGKQQAVVRAYLNEWGRRSINLGGLDARDIARWHRVVLETAFYNALGRSWQAQTTREDREAVEQQALAEMCHRWNLEPDDVAARMNR